MGIFMCYKKSKTLVEKTDFLKIYELSIDDILYRVIIPKRVANKHSFIHCKDNTIIWEQKPLIPGLAFRQAGYTMPIFRHSSDCNYITLFVIKGCPNNIIGLDDGVFSSKLNLNNKIVSVFNYRDFKKI